MKTSQGRKECWRNVLEMLKRQEMTYDQWSKMTISLLVFRLLGKYNSYFVKNFQRRHDRMIRPTVRLMSTSKSVKVAGNWRKSGAGGGGIFWVKICRGWGRGHVGSGNSVNISWGKYINSHVQVLFFTFASFTEAKPSLQCQLL